MFDSEIFRVGSSSFIKLFIMLQVKQVLARLSGWASALMEPLASRVEGKYKTYFLDSEPQSAVACAEQQNLTN